MVAFEPLPYEEDVWKARHLQAIGMVKHVADSALQKRFLDKPLG
jgi:hypothetical protein